MVFFLLLFSQILVEGLDLVRRLRPLASKNESYIMLELSMQNGTHQTYIFHYCEDLDIERQWRRVKLF